MESKEKEGVFNSNSMDKFGFDLGLNMAALESLASLIEMCDFGDIGDSPNFEYGIKCIITLVLQEQERIIEKYQIDFDKALIGQHGKKAS